MIDELKCDILDEEYAGDLDADLEDLDLDLFGQPHYYLGEYVSTELHNKYDIYACTEVTLVIESRSRFVLKQEAIDFGSDTMFSLDPLTFDSIEDIVKYTQPLKIRNGDYSIDTLVTLLDDIKF